MLEHAHRQICTHTHTHTHTGKEAHGKAVTHTQCTYSITNYVHAHTTHTRTNTQKLNFWSNCIE